ncbi:DNA-directed RNA polymerases IV and V subunit 2, partial [Mucuna pruriens]
MAIVVEDGSTEFTPYSETKSVRLCSVHLHLAETVSDKALPSPYRTNLCREQLGTVPRASRHLTLESSNFTSAFIVYQPRVLGSPESTLLESPGSGRPRESPTSKPFQNHCSVQIRSYNYFVHFGFQKVSESRGAVIPGFDPKKDDNEHYCYPHVKLGKVKLDKPKLEGSGSDTEEFKMLPRHARIQRMAYNSKFEVGVQAHAPKEVRSDKFKTGNEELLDREILKEDDREIVIERMPAMVKTNRRREKDTKDCEPSHEDCFPH